ncbi:MAG: hypothetical protein K2W86_17320 [Sphingomonas sp.]|uniref:hypothetical protein n=1 Tax=Sphingomonas sp. TaxID=28214 RepID=UPI0035A869E9|nr:hypothetical protein [Sphingomonas sp.]
MRTPKMLAFLASGLIAVAALPSVAYAKTNPVYTGTFDNVALSGYDAVGYFTQGRPVKGSATGSVANSDAVAKVGPLDW